VNDDRQSFLNAILAMPDDDAPRLIYADWLDDVGECERAELIRVQIELATMPDHCENEGKGGCKLIGPICRWHVVINRLMDMERAGWLARFAAKDWPNEFPYERGSLYLCQLRRMDKNRQPSGIAIEYVRGFIESIRCSMSDAAQHLDAIVKEHPVRRVEFTGDRPPECDVLMTVLRDRWPGIEFVLPPEPRTSFVGTQHGQAGWIEINGQRVPLMNWQVRCNTEAIEESAQMPDDAVPYARRETAAERARAMEFTGRHRRRR
jgi:uncharacterized protein (TIGR02996 family)